jgi:organic hydroperoxide reductase OsmC/OhrA
MKPLPHVYDVTAGGSSAGALVLTADGVADLAAAAPREFDGPGDEWSPESLLVAAVASCFILTFRAVARAAKLEWTHLECTVQGTLERRDDVTQFTKFMTRARLTVPATTLTVACEKALDRAERSCLVANSLRAERELQIEIDREGLQVIEAAEV